MDEDYLRRENIEEKDTGARYGSNYNYIMYRKANKEGEREAKRIELWKKMERRLAELEMGNELMDVVKKEKKIKIIRQIV